MSMKAQFLSLLLIGVISPVLITCTDLSEGADSDLCRGITSDNWEISEHQGQCYEFVSSLELWQTARNRCWKFGGRLVTIEAASTHTFLVERVSALRWNSAVWIGLNDNQHEGRWKWVTNKGDSELSPGWTNWAHRGWMDRLTGAAKDCAAMRYSENWRWKEEVCSIGLFPYICQYDVPVFQTTSPISRRTSTTTQLKQEPITTTTSHDELTATRLMPDQEVTFKDINYISDDSQTTETDPDILAQKSVDANSGTIRQEKRILTIFLSIFAFLVLLLGALLITKRGIAATVTTGNTLDNRMIWSENTGKQKYMRDMYCPSVDVIHPGSGLHATSSSLCGLKAPPNTYVPRGLAQKIVQPTSADEVYLHMGGSVASDKTQSFYMNDDDEVSDYVNEVGVAGGYEVSNPGNIYSEISERENIYQSIDEVLKEQQEFINTM